ncbi:MAG: anti-sigma factor [Chelatococcus sp.]|nr:MAG: anti-sigma factor [Chelatococcus sp.]
MSGRHVVSEETLARFAAGRLDEGLSLVVAAHIAMSPDARRELRQSQAIGGALLDRAVPIPMLSSATDLLAGAGRPAGAPAAMSAPKPAEADLPRVLAPYEIGRWRAIGRGVAMRRVAVPGAESRVFMLRAAPGTRLPEHGHTGLEWTTILSGAYEHAYGRYAAGDFDEADSEHEHHPRVDPVEGCTCIVALTGEVRFRSWLGRLLQPLVRL